MKNIIRLLLAIVLAFSLSVQSFAVSESADIPVSAPADYSEKESRAFNTYMALLTEWCEDKDNISDLTAVFPDYYGGCYINENHDFVIQIVGSIDDAISDLKSFIDTDSVIFEEVKYSYNTLLEEKNRISGEMMTMKTKTSEMITAVGIAGKENSIILYADSNKMNSYKSSKSNMLDGITEFENVIIDSTSTETEPNNLDSGMAYPGDMGSTSNAVFSAGFWCTDLLGRLGIITSAHAGVYTNVSVGFSGSYFGECSQYQCAGNVDAAFVLRENISVYPANFVPGHNIVLSNQVINGAPIGMTIYTRGCGSGARTGVVEAVNVTTNYGVYNTYVASNYCFPMDSGGIAVIYANNQYYIAGIITGATSNNKADIVRAGEICHALMVTPYTP